MHCVAGIFVGGAARRMGGRPKGLLRAPSGETLVQRWHRIFAACAIECVLIGDHPAYAHEGITMMSDAYEGSDTSEKQGPLAGLVALLGRAGTGSAIAVACDMPFVTERLVRRLVDAPWARAVAARREGRWEPFFARYDAAAALPIASAHLRSGELSLAGVLDELGAHPLVLLPHEASELDDWDTPSDVRARRRT